MSCDQQWRAAMNWVECNHRLVCHIAGPYRRYMASGAADINQEAMLTAFSTLIIMAQKDEHRKRFGAYFRVLFRTRCIKMPSGGMYSSFENIEQIPSFQSEQKIDEIIHEVVEQALLNMTNRQRQISRLILAQPCPVSTTIVASEFGIRGRTVRTIICNAIKRIEKRHYRKRSFSKMDSMSQTDIWHLAQTWVKSNRILIWCIASPYFRYMSCDKTDLESEALLTTYHVLSILMEKRKELSLMGGYFRVVFRTRCIRMTIGVRVINYDSFDRLFLPDQKEQGQGQELDQEVIDEALQVLTNRQRQIAEWILSQPRPVTISTVAGVFRAAPSTIREIISNAIRRIEKNEHQPLRGEISAAA